MSRRSLLPTGGKLPVELSEQLEGNHICNNRMGVETVAVYSDIDRDSKFVEMADRAYRVGPNPSSIDFLKLSSVIS